VGQPAAQRPRNSWARQRAFMAQELLWRCSGDTAVPGQSLLFLVEYAGVHTGNTFHPVSVWSSRATLGRYFRRLGLFITPEEVAPLLKCRTWKLKKSIKSFAHLCLGKGCGFVRRWLIPKQISCTAPCSERKNGCPSVAVGGSNCRIKHRRRPESLSVKEKKELLYDRGAWKNCTTRYGK